MSDQPASLRSLLSELKVGLSELDLYGVPCRSIQNDVLNEELSKKMDNKISQQTQPRSTIQTSRPEAPPTSHREMIASPESKQQSPENQIQEIMATSKGTKTLKKVQIEETPAISLNIYQKYNLEELQNKAQSCKDCRLCEGRDKVVFGSGKTDKPLIAFVGEGPGADEDRQGVPFVGRAGQLLTLAITNGLKMNREDLYICNVVKCRPPENRAPLPDEVSACTQYLFRQLELVSPKVIITLGQPAQRALSGVDLGITKLRGQWQTWRGVPLMPTFHPAYLLRNPPAKKEFWEDLKSVMKYLGV